MTKTAKLVELGHAGLRLLSDAIKKLDPDGHIVKLDVDVQTVSYSSDIVTHEVIATYAGEEEPVRAYIVCWLCTEGGYLPQNLELEKRYSIGRPKVGAKLDILLKRPDGTPFALVEVKAPAEYEADQDKFIRGQLFALAPFESGTAVLGYATVVASGASVRVHTITIDYTKHTTFNAWKSSGASSDALPVNYDEPVHQHFVKAGPHDLRTDVTLAEFQHLRRRLHDVLWKGSTADNTIYAYIVRLFLAKIFDEKHTDDGKEYQFQIIYSANKRESAQDTFKRIREVYARAYKRYLGGDKKGPSENLNSKEFSHEQLAFVVTLLQGISITQNTQSNADILGTFFEGITREGYKQGKGSYFTHVNLVIFILKVLQVEELAAERIRSSSAFDRRLPFIMDTSCGSGTFLLAAMNMISRYTLAHKNEIAKNDDTKAYVRSHFPDDDENLWAKEYLYGIDANELVAMAAKVNMVLQKDGNMHIIHADGLAPLGRFDEARLRGRPHRDKAVYSKQVAESFDVIVSNPPFSITLAPDTISTLESSFELADDRNSENLFLERWYQLLKPKGRLGVVLPESFFSTRENLDARLFLLAHFNVKAVVSLPRHAFEPYTPTKTSILFAEKKDLTEEKRFKDAAVKFEAEAFDAKSLAAASLRRISSTAEQLAEQLVGKAIEARSAASRLGVTVPELTAGDDFATLDATSKAWSSAAAAVVSGRSLSADARDVKAFVATLARRVTTIETALSAAVRHRAALELEGEPLTSALTLGELVLGARRQLQQVNEFDVRVWAFGKVVATDDAQFAVLNVENIGYKRTRRAESPRPNALFNAYATVANGGGRVSVPNLHDSTTQWHIDIGDRESARDALSQLEDLKLWH